MTTPCTDCPLRCQPMFQPMSAEEIAFMQVFKSAEVEVPAGQVLLWEGQPSPWLFSVLRGQGLRSKMLPDGDRQVVNFVFPGDFIGLQSGVMGEMKHSVEATTDMTLCRFARVDLWRVFRDQPARAFDLTYLAATEEHFLGEALLTLGQRDATSRLAWALLRLWRRAVATGMQGPRGVPLPWRQRDLADALGLSLVHTNKTLARLRILGAAHWSGGYLAVPDPALLADLAQEEDGAATPRPLF